MYAVLSFLKIHGFLDQHGYGHMGKMLETVENPTFFFM